MNRIGKTFTILGLLGSAAAFAEPDPQPEPPRPPAPPHILTAEGSVSFLGVGVAEIDAERAKELKLKEERGVEVKSVEDDSPAGKSGVKVGDIVIEYNGQAVAGVEQFIRLVRETPAGRQAKLLIWRNGSTQTITTAIGSRRIAQILPRAAGFDQLNEVMRRMQVPPDVPRAMMSMQNHALGVETESLNPQLSEYFGVKDGVLVRQVMRGSAAEKAGMKAGDVITKIGDRKVSGPGEISSAVRASRGSTFPVVVVRNQKELTLSVTVDEKPRGSIVKSAVVLTL